MSIHKIMALGLCNFIRSLYCKIKNTGTFIIILYFNFFVLFVKVCIVALSVNLKVNALICMDFDEGQSKVCPSDKNVCVVGCIFLNFFHLLIIKNTFPFQFTHKTKIIDRNLGSGLSFKSRSGSCL